MTAAVRASSPGTPAGSAYGVELALRATGLLADFNAAGVLSAADVHTAHRLGVLSGESDDTVLLAAALVVRSTRHGSVVLDLATAHETTSPDVDNEGDVDQGGTATSNRAISASGADAATPADALAGTAALPWPSPGWVARVAASPLVTKATEGARASTGGPLRIAGTRIWLARYWDQEEQVARDLLARATATLDDDLDAGVLERSLERLFRPADLDQRAAARTCSRARVSVLAGGPGTGKTTTVSRLLAVLREQHPDWRIALAAPTGKAAARLEAAVRASTAGFEDDADRERLGELSATTLHRLLGWRPGARSRFRHDATNRLPYEVVVVDEASMVSLTLMARLLEALRPTTRLILVGDPDQLASVEAGAVLGDLVDSTTMPPPTRALTTDSASSTERTIVRPRIAVAMLTTNHRFDATSGIALLANAIQDGRGDDALAILRDPTTPEVELVEVEDGAPLGRTQLFDVRQDVVTAGGDLLAAAASGDAAGALEALDRHRLLCAHRRGPRGVAHWSALAQRWIADEHPVAQRVDGRYAGEPLLVTANDYELGLYNGDTGVVVASGDDGGLVAMFGRGGEPIPVPLVRLGAVRPLHAMTVHRSQGSQFGAITLLLAAAGSPLGTRETLYTAVTRATTRVRVIGSAAALIEAVGRPAARATGLRDRLAGTL